MVKWFTHNYNYDESWSTVTLAFFLRYPNPYASHVLSADVISRSISPEGLLITKRLILKQGAVPKWLPRGMVSRAESWIIEESQVDPFGKVVQCETKNLDHVKILSVRETVELRETSVGTTAQKTQATVVSNFGWGLAKRIERYGHEKFQRNLERSRAGISLVLDLLHQSRLQTLPYAADVGAYPGTGTIFETFRPRIYSPRSSSSSSYAPSDPTTPITPSHTQEAVYSVSDDSSSRDRRKWSDLIPRPSLPVWFAPRTPCPPSTSSSPVSTSSTSSASEKSS